MAKEEEAATRITRIQTDKIVVISNGLIQLIQSSFNPILLSGSSFIREHWYKF